jgi:4-hydroxy-tetrahydrodipicolinate reductase
MAKTRVVSFGLGPIGVRAARLALTRKDLDLVGAIDADPTKIGLDLGELFDPREHIGVRVEGDLAALDRLRPDVVLHCTSSFLPRVESQLLACCERGIDVVSSTEELLLPEAKHPELAARLQAAATAGGATLLGTGVNPGFAMDFLALVASAATDSVERVRCVRVVDAASRRLPLQQKVGAGLTAAEFAARQQTGTFGHIGMRESVALLDRALGFGIDGYDESLTPVIASQARRTPFLTVPAGHVAGIRNVGRGRRGDRVVLDLVVGMYV